MPRHSGHILRLLRDAGPLPRAELARRSGLSATTLTKLASRLIARGLVGEVDGRSSAAPPIGRPPVDLALLADACSVLAVHIGVGSVRIALTNLRAEPGLATSFRFRAGEDGAEAVIGRVARKAEALIARAGLSRKRIVGIGVAAPGPVDRDRRNLLLSINIGWRDVPLAPLLERATGLPVIVEHNVRAMALGEYRYGGGRESHSLLFVYLRTGIGAGMVIDGAPFRPGRHGVTELGHIRVVANGRRCACGGFGCLETVLSKRDLTASVSRAGGDPGRLMQSVAAIDAVRTRTVDALSTALASAVNLLNPDLIVLGGIFADAPNRLFVELGEELHHKVFPVLRGTVRLQRSSLGNRIGVVGAAAACLDSLLYDAARTSSQSLPHPAPPQRNKPMTSVASGRAPLRG